METLVFQSNLAALACWPQACTDSGGVNHKMKNLVVLCVALAGLSLSGYSAPVAPAPGAFFRPGTRLRVRLDETIDTRRNRAGDRFTATLAEPLVYGDRVVAPRGTRLRGHVVEAKPSGRFKGRAILGLSLDSMDLRGRVYAIRSTTFRSSRGHKKHNWLWIGGGSGGGALIGAAAAGGPAALIGAGAGAAAGTLGAAITGKRQIYVPAESRVTFVLRRDLDIGG